MTTPREWAVAAPLPDGDVLIAGGGSTADASLKSWLSTAEVYDSRERVRGRRASDGRVKDLRCNELARRITRGGSNPTAQPWPVDG